MSCSLAQFTGLRIPGRLRRELPVIELALLLEIDYLASMQAVYAGRVIKKFIVLQEAL
jgi:hypothetical protein